MKPSAGLQICAAFTFTYLLCLREFAFASNVNSTVHEFTPVLQLKHGKIRGLVKDEASAQKKVLFYEGIRYGQANRFSVPKPADPWTEDVYNATRPRFACPQQGAPVRVNLTDEVTEDEKVGCNEDCLYLSVWRPAEEKANRSVMVWIHGGGFYVGGIFNSHDGGYVSAVGEVVVVSVAYRLGAFGWLYGNDSNDAPGNLGLHDQILALQWIRDNIQYFGGNPADVTMFGQSAGSISIGALVLSPLANGLFHRAILQSGVPNSYLGSQSIAKTIPKVAALGEKLGCTQNVTHEIVACLRTKSTEQILKSDKNSIADGESFTPVYGDVVMPLRPVEALKTGKFNPNVDLLFGVTSGEGSGFVTGYVPQMTRHDGRDMTFALTKTMIGFMFQLFQEPYYKEVAEYYMKNVNATDKDDLRRAVSASFGDYHLVCPTMLYTEQLVKVNPQKRHYYSYRLTHAPEHGCHGWQGVCHAEDNHFVFGSPAKNPENYSDFDRALSAVMVRAWTNFAKTGNPGKIGETQWEEAFARNAHVGFMQLDPQEYKMVQNYYVDLCDGFWKAKIFA